mmetsp:Transcript_12667/g.30921  ORF Transcript_12667/g.30921 Transcript_12667/m.30921 type:complete len:126 (-) Transcript_12667:185-562(-)
MNNTSDTGKPQSMMASFSSAIDMVSRYFCCPLLNVVEEPCHLAASQPDTQAVRITKLATTASPLMTMPRIHQDRYWMLNRQQNAEDVTGPSLGPPDITRYPNPWILLAQETPKRRNTSVKVNTEE